MDVVECGMVVRDVAGGGRGTLLWVHGLGESRLCFERALGCPDPVDLPREEGLARRLRGLPVPVRYIAGSPGGAAPRSLELLAEAGVPVTVISPAGHWPFIDCPRELAAAVVRHVEEEAA